MTLNPTPTRRIDFLLIVAVCAIAFVALAIVAAGQQPSLGHMLYALGYTRTSAPGDLYFDTSQPSSVRFASGTFNPNSAINCTKPCEGGRYGWDKNTKGYLVGPEGTSADALQAAIEAGCLPGVPTGYRVQGFDYYDSLNLKDGSTSVYGARVKGCGGPAPTPRPTATPSPTATPPPPQPTPSPTSCPVVDCPPVPPQCAPLSPAELELARKLATVWRVNRQAAVRRLVAAVNARVNCATSSTGLLEYRVEDEQ